MMFRYELLRILRNPKWKYVLLILLGSILYFVTMTNDASLELNTMLRLRSVETLQSASLLPVVVLCFLLYNIAEEEEHMNTWKTLLSNSIPQGKRILSKILVLLLFQLPILCVPMLFYYVVSGTFSVALLVFSLCMQALYLTSFLYYTFEVSSGYLSQMGSIKIVNVLKITTPIFLFFCTTNISDWMYAYNLLWKLIIGVCVVLMLVVVVCNRVFMHRKLYREMILYKIFGFAATRQNEMMMEKYHAFGDHMLQMLFRLFPKKSTTYWRVCAFIEVGLKLNGFYIVIGCICFILWKGCAWFIFLVLAIICFVYVIYSCIKERNKIHHVCIRVNM